MSNERTKHSQSTFMAKKGESSLNWFILDAKGKTLGRLASEISKILRGKHKPTFTPHADTGDGVVVLNAGKVKVTGSKAAQKLYRYYTGYISGLREIPYEVMKDRKPEYIIEHAVKGMMPKTKLGRAQLKRLRIFAKDEHAMDAQQPIQVTI
jgi:large subunit ribosomal protein L13